jgi:hypothetical protein
VIARRLAGGQLGLGQRAVAVGVEAREVGAPSSGTGGQLVRAELAVAVGVEVGEQTVEPGLVSGGALGVRDRAVAVGVEALVAIAMTAAAILGGGHALGRGGGGGGGIGVLGAAERGEETEVMSERGESLAIMTSS